MLVRFGNEGYTSNKMIVQLQGVKKISSFRDRQNSAKKKNENRPVFLQNSSFTKLFSNNK